MALLSMVKSGGPEPARQMAGSCFELVGSHQCHVCTSCSGHTGLKYHRNHTLGKNLPPQKPNQMYYRFLSVRLESLHWILPRSKDTARSLTCCSQHHSLHQRCVQTQDILHVILQLSATWLFVSILVSSCYSLFRATPTWVPKQEVVVLNLHPRKFLTRYKKCIWYG